MFNRLKPKISKTIGGETLKLRAKLHRSTSKINSQCNVCSTIGYENTIDNVKSNEAWLTFKDKLDAANFIFLAISFILNVSEI